MQIAMHPAAFAALALSWLALLAADVVLIKAVLEERRAGIHFIEPEQMPQAMPVRSTWDT